MDFRSFMMQEINDEFMFLPEGYFIEDVVDSDDASAGDNENPLVQKMDAQASKVAGKAFDPLDVASDPDIHEFPLAKEDRAYAGIERKCNEAILDLHKNPLVVDMWTKIETLQGRVDGLHSECTRLDRASVVAKVLLDAATKLIRSDEMGMLFIKLLKASIIYGMYAALEEVAKLKEPFVMEKMASYRPSSKQEYD
nr:hypothetical protein [Tanacetum cinerariifolium]